MPFYNCNGVKKKIKMIHVELTDAEAFISLQCAKQQTQASLKIT